MFKFDCFFATNVGKVRKNNEDNFYFNGLYKRAPEETHFSKKDLVYHGGLFAVCDGMGGEEYGEKASLFAVESLKEFQNKDFNKYVNEYIEKANKRICDLIEENNGTRSGTTLALIYINNGRFVSYNIGDSRVYLFRNGKLTQISKDHTRVSQMIKMGVMTKEQASTHKDRHVLTQHLGIFPDELIIQAYKSPESEIINNDLYLLCSDGLTDMLQDSEIESILKKEASAKEYVETLIKAALENGGKDNVTVGIIKNIGKKEKFLDKIFRRK